MRTWRWVMAAVTLAAAATLCAPGHADLAKRKDAASEKMGMKLSLQCYTFRELTFFETVDEAAKMGIRYLEIYPGQKVRADGTAVISKDMSDETVAEIKKKLADAGGLKLVAYGVDGIPEDEVGARRVFDWAKKMGIGVLVTETTPNDVFDKLCREYKIRIALHNHPQSWLPDDVLKATAGHSRLIGSCSDTGHWMRRDLNPIEQFKKLQGRVEHCHFKDLNKFGGDGRDVPWGTGQGDARGMLAELKRQGYRGYLSIEYEIGSVSELEANLPKCVEFFDKTTTELAQRK